MELNRKSYADESYLVLRKQQASIAKLRADNEALKMELGMETRSSAVKPAELAETSRLHDEAEKLERLMQDESRAISACDEQVLSLKQKTAEQRRSMGGVNAARENMAMVTKQVKILENRLDQALVKFNQALARNKSLREAIDDLRRERVVFDNIYRKLERELHEKKRAMANVIELSNLSYEQRDNYQMEIAAIEQANRKEQDEFEAQMLELGRLLEHELRLPAPAALGASTSAKALEAAAADEGRPKRKAARPGPAQRDSQAKAELQVGEERVQNFEEAFHRIQAATGIAAIDDLVRMFIKNEDQNFSLFNYVNEQTNDLEKLGEQVQHLQDEQAKYTQESGDDVTQHKQLVSDLERRLDATEAAAVKYEAKCDAHAKVLNSLKKGIASAFAKTKCDDPTENFAELAVTEATLLPHLAAIEQQCNRLIKDYGAAKQRAARAHAGAAADVPTDAPASALGLGPTTPMGQDLVHVNPPKLDDYSSDDDDDDDDDDDETRPLTRDELKAKTLNRMYRRVNRDAGARKAPNRQGAKAKK
mmetsp:Transcript_12144/g.42918  ORF Transcript_12144/g.42918 Transcript_12144/m.42918 type:complete len:536 (-) Transcript_12144:45-1652(-)